MAQNSLNDVLIKKLFSTEEKLTLQALAEIQNSGNSKYIPSLIELLHTQNNESIEIQIIKILSEVKHPDAIDEFVIALENPRYQNLVETILSTCWQNGLDFSKHLDVFVKFLIEGDYMVAFEAYTIIQNTEGVLSFDSAKHIEDKLNEAVNTTTEDRKSLINDVLNYLPTITAK